MNEVAYNADWSVVYPRTSDVQEITRGLRSRLMCNWSWDLFLWNLSELRRLLTQCPSEYNYFYLTRFLMARATYLVLNGPFQFHAADMVARLAQQNVQFAGIYLYLFLCELERAKFTKHPVTYDRQDERSFQFAITEMEETFRQLLQVIVCVNDPHVEILEHSIREWMAGRLHNKDGSTMNLLPAIVPVKVQADELRSYRKINPAPFDLGCKLLKKEPIFPIRERHGHETACDMELERLCSWNFVEGHPAIRYGEDAFQYFTTTVNESRDTLYVVCADRTLQMVHTCSAMPGSVPREIHASWKSENKNVYEVCFDNGVHGVCALSFRSHSADERRQVPASVTRQVNRRGLDLVGCQGTKVVGTVETGRESPIPRRSSHFAEAARDMSSYGGQGANGRVREIKTTSAVPAFCKNLPVATVRNNWREVLLPSGETLDLGGKKRKRRELLRAVWEHCIEEGRRDFLFETVRSNYSESQAFGVKSDRFRHDVFKGDPDSFDEMFAVIGSPADEKYRLRVAFVVA